jgi:geranylgeranyl diphosphate synthase type II
MTHAPAAAFLELAAELRPQIDAALDRASQYDEQCPARLRDAIRHSLLAPGKRLRPLLVLMACDACGFDSRQALPAACAVEMVHTYSLIHDDLPAMDDDDLRRGLPTCHAAFDEATAILAGDALLAGAFEVLASGGYSDSVTAKTCLELAQAAGAKALVGGQADDLSAEFAGGDVVFLEHIHRRKTGALFLASLRLGGLVAHADVSQMAALEGYGRALGLAFQIVDDLLDLQGDTEAMGKRTMKDSDLGKLTFPALLGVEESQRRAEQLVAQACAALAPLGERARSLEGLARYVLERKQ